jgi:DNA-binding MarR family transcriptional regulator
MAGLMARTAPEDPKTLDAWRELQERHARVSCALDKALESGHRLTTSEFEVLEYLSAADERHARMQDLADAVHLSQSATSRLVGRLEEQELVCRSICNDDRRGIFTSLTDAGASRFTEARGTHRRVLEETL